MKFCPHCGENISAHIAADANLPIMESVVTSPTPGKYDPVEIGRRVLSLASGRRAVPPSTADLVTEAMRPIRPRTKKTTVFLALDKEVVPTGGVLHRATMLEGRSEMSAERLKKLGYALDDDDHIIVVNDVPVGPVYQILQYWGGEKQHHRWHLKYAIDVNPRRNGEKFFMDENLVVFGAEWKDTQSMDVALSNLLELFRSGLKGQNFKATPLALELMT